MNPAGPSAKPCASTNSPPKMSLSSMTRSTSPRQKCGSSKAAAMRAITVCAASMPISTTRTTGGFVWGSVTPARNHRSAIMCWGISRNRTGNGSNGKSLPSRTPCPCCSTDRPTTLPAGLPWHCRASPSNNFRRSPPSRKPRKPTPGQLRTKRSETALGHALSRAMNRLRGRE